MASQSTYDLNDEVEEIQQLSVDQPLVTPPAAKKQKLVLASDTEEDEEVEDTPAKEEEGPSAIPESEEEDGLEMMEKLRAEKRPTPEEEVESPVKTTKMTKKTRQRLTWERDDENRIITVFRETIKAPARPKKADVCLKFRRQLPDIYDRESGQKCQERCFDKVRSLWKRHSEE